MKNKKISPKTIYIIVCILALIAILIMFISSILSNSSNNGNTNSTQSANSSTDNNTDEQQNTVEYSQMQDNLAEPISNITNYDEVVENLPNTEFRKIIDVFNYTLKLNAIQNQVSDAVIRDGSYHQSLIDTNKLIYKTTFIVDIPSLQQSYFVRDLYSPLPVEQSGLRDYVVQVSCPSDDQLIYAPFDCIDRVRYEINGAS